MSKRWALIIALVFVGGSVAQATVIGYGGSCPSCSTIDNDPTSGSKDWANDMLPNGLSGAGYSNWSVSFDTPPVGTLASNFYSLLGVPVTIDTSVGSVFNTDGVQNTGGGPGQTGGGGTASIGEMLSPSNNGYLGPNPNQINGSFGTANGTVTFNLTKQTYAFGVFIVDLNNAGGTNNPVTLTAYSGLNGTGALIATITAVGDNFQPNYEYWMGLLSTTASIGSVIFNNVSSTDYVALDGARFVSTGVSNVPEPSSMALMFGGGLALLALRFRKRSAR